MIAEGVETGLSLVIALPSTNVQIVLGKSNLLHIDSKSTAKNIVFCLDNDGKNCAEDKIIFESAKRLNDLGKTVNFIVPKILGNQKQDYNDVVKKAGIEPIRSDLSKSIPYGEMYGSRSEISSSSASLTQGKATQLVNQSLNNSVRKETEFLNQCREFQNKTMTKTLNKQINFEREI